MKLLKMQTPSCTLYSAAMLLDEEPENLIKELGHDGLEVWWPDQHGPGKYRGVHIQEIQDICASRGFALSLIEAYPMSIPNEGASPKPVFKMGEASERLVKALHNRLALLIGQGAGRYMHACAWDGKRVFDPQGRTYELDNFRIREAWILVASLHH